MAVDLKGGWSTFWGSFNAAMNDQVRSALTIVGVILIVAAVITWIFQKRRGQPVQLGRLGWTIAAGAVLAGPDLVIPGLLGVVDLIVNAFINLWTTLFG